MTTEPAAPEIRPNHHAHYPPFRGMSGLTAALSMAFARGECTALAIDLSEPVRTDRLLDLGCGPGAPAREVAQRVDTVTGIDPASVMVRVAKLIPSKSNITWKIASAESTGEPDASATIVWALASVHHWDDLDSASHEVLRVLKPNGRFIAIERCIEPGAKGHASHGWTPNQGVAFANVCTAAGFRNAEMLERTVGATKFIAVRANA